MRRSVQLWAAGLLLAACGGGEAERPEERPAEPASATSPPSLVLLSLDTTRADRLGAYGAGDGRTPHLDALAARGSRWERAIAPAPLTLPSHATLLTGLDPPAHGVRENGTAVLPAELPTLATVLAAAGYDTAAFVSSRVLDRRFGLDRGFAVYDDRIAAERMGEYGYPERDAQRVTESALAWLAGRRRFFLWVHYYDPHSPYSAPGGDPRRPARERYDAEIAHMDRWIGRLLAALPDRDSTLVAAVGDHGEMLGEHGEPNHGLFLYRSSLRVPLIVAGPGVLAGRIEPRPVAIRDLAASLLVWLGLGAATGALPGATLDGGQESPPAGARPIYSETWLPAGAYGWSPLAAITEGPWRLVVAPRPELYDVATDPGERVNRLDSEPEVARRLKRRLDGYLTALPTPVTAPPGADDELAAELASLGYLTGSAAADARPGRGLDPKDGLPLLARFEAAQRRLAEGDAAGAAEALSALVAESPGNLPFTTLWGRALFAAGRVEEAIAAYRRAADLAPALDLVHVNLADAYLAAGRPEEAGPEFRLAAELNPGSARAWGRLAQIELAAGDGDAARRWLIEGLDAGAASASLLTLLAELEQAAGASAAAETRLIAAVELEPSWYPAWLALGRLRLERADVDGARLALQKAATPGTETAAEASRLLSSLR